MTTPESEYCTVAEAARALHVSKPTIWRWIDSGRLPALRIGGRVIRIRRRDLDALVQPARHSMSEAELEKYTVRHGDPNIDQLELAERLLQRSREAIAQGTPLLSDSAELIREAREEREQELDERERRGLR